jgi:hypothetical protein
MADDDTDHGDNRPEDMILDEKVVKMGEELAAIFTKRKNLNLEAKNIYTNADKLGIPPAALQAGVRMVRMMDKSDRVKYQAGVRRTLRALEPAAADLFPEDIERIKKRQERAKARAEKDAKAAGKETPAEQERRLAADLNPRSKPKASSAKKPAVTNPPIQDGDVSNETGDELIARVAREKLAEQEQRDGEALLATAGKGDAQGLTGMTGLGSVVDERPLSQSAQAAAVREQLGLDKN